MLQADENNLSLTFYLTSQIEARTPAGQADPTSNTSKLRTDTTLYLYKPLTDEEEDVEGNEETKEHRISLTGHDTSGKEHLTKSMYVKIAGVAGLGA